jgi:hypothetical protein
MAKRTIEYIVTFKGQIEIDDENYIEMSNEEILADQGFTELVTNKKELLDLESI